MALDGASLDAQLQHFGGHALSSDGGFQAGFNNSSPLPKVRFEATIGASEACVEFTVSVKQLSQVADTVFLAFKLASTWVVCAQCGGPFPLVSSAESFKIHTWSFGLGLRKRSGPTGSRKKRRKQDAILMEGSSARQRTRPLHS